MGFSHTTMDIVGLGFFKERAILASVNHATMHGDRVGEDGIDQTGTIGFSHGVDTAF